MRFTFFIYSLLVSSVFASEKIYKNSMDSVFGIISVSNGMEEITGLGTGFFIDKNCLAVTNHHVVKNKKEESYIIYQEKSNLREKVKVIAHSKLLDLAILKPIRKIKCKPLKISTKNVYPGQKVYALGNPVGLEGSISSGIISGLNRSIGKDFFHRFIQVDAPIYPGNSGGPLLNTVGEVVGVNTARQEVGLSFALPIKVFSRLKRELLKNGKIKKRVLGIRAARPSPDSDNAIDDFLKGKFDGLIVTKVKKGSPAFEAGLKKKDRIIKANGKRLSSLNDLKMEVNSQTIGSKTILVVERDKKIISLKIKIKTKDKK